jgi:hypothetical protein
MGAPCTPGLIDSPSVLETTLARRGRRWQAWLATMLLALAAGCSSAPIAGKPCECPTGYVCCGLSQTCMANEAQCRRCTPVRFASPIMITRDGAPHSNPDGGPDAVQFGTPPAWVSYTYPGSADDQATLTLTPDGNGFHVTATVMKAYAGVGLSYLGGNDGTECIDGTDLTGVKFDFDGDPGGHVLKLSVAADDDVSTMFDPRGICTGGTMCFGPSYNVHPVSGQNTVPFQLLDMGVPVSSLGSLSLLHLIKVQWELDPATNPSADFTISNVQLY